MTEYDYSPEGYERYLATQTRVSKWVNQQAACSPHYSSPFVPRPEPTPPSAYDYRPPPSRKESSSRHSSRSSSRPDHRRVYSEDSYNTPRYPAPTSYMPPGAPPNAVYRTYNYDSTAREVVIPAPRPGETYVIIPPDGRRIEVITDGETSVHTSSSRRSSRSSVKKSQPLLKRLFSNMSPPPRESGYESSSRSRSSSRSHRTRSY